MKWTEVLSRTEAEIEQATRSGSLRARLAGLAVVNPRGYRRVIARLGEALRECGDAEGFRVPFALAYYAQCDDPLGVSGGKIPPMETVLRDLLDAALRNSTISNMHPEKVRAIEAGQQQIISEMRARPVFRQVEKAARLLSIVEVRILDDGQPEDLTDIAVRIAEAAKMSPKRHNEEFREQMGAVLAAFIEEELLNLEDAQKKNEA